MTTHDFFERIAARLRRRATRWLAIAGVAYAAACACAEVDVVPAVSGVALFALAEYRRCRDHAESVDRVHVVVAAAEYLRLPERGTDVSPELHVLDRLFRDVAAPR